MKKNEEQNEINCSKQTDKQNLNRAKQSKTLLKGYTIFGLSKSKAKLQARLFLK